MLIASNGKVSRPAVFMLETSGRRAGLIIQKKTRPTLGIGRPRNAASGYTRVTIEAGRASLGLVNKAVRLA
jgi:hypothetical protein